ncbi:hypothetical protein BV25DRAFT_1808320 [Artomyces pyxidatus]|uniref:Uncharacterized protein n=1 Tax=Artomyces pyxidatus TaxID=48021 RepID=A0ACB8SUZ8_9AGAM|nr:hypothetical protein BV25DRAFT_1808320 [Artomyces pyxidatus]
MLTVCCTHAPLTFPLAYIGHDHPRELQIKLDTVNAIYSDDDEHYALEGVQAMAEWATIRPPGMGFVFLGEGDLPFGVSMWHQIDCLNHIRIIMVQGEPPTGQTRHCFNYLRQALMCNGDIVLDPGGSSQIAPGGGTIAPTTHSSHTCRDWRQVYKYMADEHEKWTPEQKEVQQEVVRDTIHAPPAGLDVE